MKTQVADALGLLGHRVQDKVTRCEGIVTSISFDLYGCVQALVNPGMGSDGKLMDLAWFDVSRLALRSNEPVMDVPDFGVGKGPEMKPPSRSL